MPEQYRKKPVVVSAMKYEGGIQSADKVIAWAIPLGVEPGMRYERLMDTLNILTLEGMMSASPGDWIIRGVEGEFYPCKPSIFEASYEPVPNA